jgi:hypothetical protein
VPEKNTHNQNMPSKNNKKNNKQNNRKNKKSKKKNQSNKIVKSIKRKQKVNKSLLSGTVHASSSSNTSTSGVDTERIDRVLQYEREACSNSSFYLYREPMIFNITVPAEYQQHCNSTEICPHTVRSGCVKRECNNNHIKSRFWREFAKDPTHYVKDPLHTSQEYHCLMIVDDITESDIDQLLNRFATCIDYFKENRKLYLVFDSEEDRDQAADTDVLITKVTRSRPLFVTFDSNARELALLRCNTNDSYSSDKNAIVQK